MFDGLDVEVANGGEDGIKKTTELKPDLILLDVMMPEPNGMQVLDKLKENPETKDIPVIILTNLSGKYDADLARKKGAVDFWIKKDSEPKDLGKKIKEIVEKHKMESDQS